MKRVSCVLEQVCGFRLIGQAGRRAFHGTPATKMVEAVKKAGGEVKYTEYAGVGHNSWDNAYGDADAIKWLLSQRRK